MAGRRDIEPPFFRRKERRRQEEEQEATVSEEQKPIKAELLQTIPQPGKASDGELQSWLYAEAQKRLSAANEAIRGTRRF